MIPAPIFDDDLQRLSQLYALGLLDTDPDPSFDRVTRLAQRVFAVPTVLVSLVDRDRQWFKSRVGLDATETPRDVSFCGHAIAGTDVFVVEDAHDDPRFADNPLVTGAPNVRFYAGAPLRSPDGAALGTLCLLDQEPRHLSADELATLADLAEIIEAEIAQMCAANTDPLTGLLNRRGFLVGAKQLLAVAHRLDTPVALAYADVDGLKALNDGSGHHEGDALLRAVGRLIRKTVREADLASRLGGDEFALLFCGLAGEGVGLPLGRLTAAIAEHNRAGDGPTISLSVGCEDWVPPETIAALLDRADQTMYAIKRERSSRAS